MKYTAKVGLTLASGKRVEEGESVTEAQLGKSVGWLVKRGKIEAQEEKPKEEPKEEPKGKKETDA